jgi:GTP-binding protein EngB required for normal cell division
MTKTDKLSRNEFNKQKQRFATILPEPCKMALGTTVKEKTWMGAYWQRVQESLNDLCQPGERT